MKYYARASGTCGELLQGYVNGNDFLINSPIPFYAHAEVSVEINKNIEIKNEKKHLKIKKVLEKIKTKLRFHDLGLRVQINSQIPRGKGLASSTSELTAVVLATCNALNLTLSDEEIVKLIIEVDGSSDGVFLPGVSFCNHLTGEIYKIFPKIPQLSFIIVDTGGEVSTQHFDRDKARAVATQHEFTLRRAISILEKGFSLQSSKLIAQAATMSATVNQNVLYKSPFVTLLDGTKEFGGLGVNCAHTGSVLGVMFDSTETDEQELLKRVYQLIHPLPILGVYPLIGGGRISNVTKQLLANEKIF